MAGGAEQSLTLFGVTLIGATPENGQKLLITAAYVVAALVVGWVLRRIVFAIGALTGSERFAFWTRQIVSILLAFALILGVISIWFDDPARLATAAGLVTAGLAFALQRVITATAGYLVILRGKTFNVGDRIVMGGVRGDVIALSFMQTKIMEMGQTQPIVPDEPASWVHSRQFTGRIVTVSNDKVFDEPIFNYTRNFPYLWEEMRLPIRYGDDRAKAEEILLTAARRHAVHDHATREQLHDLERRYGLHGSSIAPRVYWRLTDNWVELTVRFLAPDHGSRDLKDAMSREVIAALDEAGIGIASATYEITGVPPLKLDAR